LPGWLGIVMFYVPQQEVKQVPVEAKKEARQCFWLTLVIT